MAIDDSIFPATAHGTRAVARSPLTLDEFELMKKSALFGDDDVPHCAPRTRWSKTRSRRILDVWYGFVGSQPHLLASFTGKRDGKPLGDYLGAVRKRFGQWILDTARAEYDQQWLDYQHEIGLRHHRTQQEPDRRCSFHRHRAVPRPVRADLPGDVHAQAVPGRARATRARRSKDACGVGQVVPAAADAVESPLREGRRLLMVILLVDWARRRRTSGPGDPRAYWLVQTTPEPRSAFCERLSGPGRGAARVPDACPACVARGCPRRRAWPSCSRTPTRGGRAAQGVRAPSSDAARVVARVPSRVHTASRSASTRPSADGTHPAHHAGVRDAGHADHRVDRRRGPDPPPGVRGARRPPARGRTGDVRSAQAQQDTEATDEPGRV